MIPNVVLAQAGSDSLVRWLGVIGQWVGGLGTVTAVAVALWLAQRDRRWNEAERRDREAAQARLVTLTIGYPEPGDSGPYAVPWVKIHNHGERPVHRPRIESIVDAQPPVRWGCEQTIYDEYTPPEELPAGAWHKVPFEHVSVDGLSMDSTITPGLIKKFVDVDDVTIAFTDTPGLRWRRTGNGNPARVVQQILGTE